MKNLCWKGMDTDIFVPDLIKYAFVGVSLFRCKIDGRRLLKWITQCDLLTFALVKLLVFVPLFYAPKNIVLKQALICPGHYGNDLAASVFFNVCIAEHVTERCDAQLDIPLCRRAHRSVAPGQSKRSANVLLTGKPNPARITLWHTFIFLFII